MGGEVGRWGGGGDDDEEEMRRERRDGEGKREEIVQGLQVNRYERLLAKNLDLFQRTLCDCSVLYSVLGGRLFEESLPLQVLTSIVGVGTDLPEENLVGAMCSEIVPTVGRNHGASFKPTYAPESGLLG